MRMPPVSLNYFVKRKRDADWRILERTIPDHELVLIINGTGYVTLEGREFPLEKGTLLHFFPGKRHALYTDKEPFMEFYGLHFESTDEKEIPEIPQMCQLVSTTKLEHLLSCLLDIWAKKEYRYEWRQEILLQEILYEIVSLRFQNPSASNIQRIRRVCSFIHEHPYQNNSLEELARIAGLKKSYFTKIFSEINGVPPIQYRNRLKLEHSKDFLLNHSVKETADLCGFSDELYFSRCFKKTFGFSPSHYQKLLRS